MRLLCLWPLLLAVGGGAQDELPPPVDVRAHLPDRLKAPLKAPRPKTSQIEWTITWSGGEVDGMVERFVTRTVGDVIWQTNYGDERGYHYDRQRDKDGNRIIRENAFPGTRESLIYDGHAWSLPTAEPPSYGRIASLDRWPGYLPLDFTTAGMYPVWQGAEADQTWLGLSQHEFWGFESATFTSFTTAGLERIVAEFTWRRPGGQETRPHPDHARRIEWDLDPRRGGQPVRAAYYKGDLPVYWSETELFETGGRWLPRRMRFFVHGAPARSHVLQVHKASFDEPWHMQEIRPEDIGVVFLTQFSGTWRGQSHRFAWDGTDMITFEDYQDLVWVHGVDPHPRIVEFWAESWSKKSHMSHEEKLAAQKRRMQRDREVWRERYYKKHGRAPWLVQPWKKRDEWDVYVEKFIEKHELDQKREEKAEDILRRAKQLRDYNRRKNNAKLEQARREGAEARVKHLEERGKERIQHIFDDLLVANLERLVPGDKKP